VSSILREWIRNSPFVYSCIGARKQVAAILNEDVAGTISHGVRCFEEMPRDGRAAAKLIATHSVRAGTFRDGSLGYPGRQRGPFDETGTLLRCWGDGPVKRKCSIIMCAITVRTQRKHSKHHFTVGGGTGGKLIGTGPGALREFFFAQNG